MELSEYQRIAAGTDQRPLGDDPQNDDAVVIPLLGLVGEVGTLHVQYKKFLRDGAAYRLFPQHVSEELGDILWYVANLAMKFGLSLSDIAEENLVKIADRWSTTPRSGGGLLDDTSPGEEQLPREFRIEFRPVVVPSRPETMVQGRWQGGSFGDPLGDNAYQEDWYRYHDAMHLAHAAVLGWSPVCRKEGFFGCKRRSDPVIDAVEDGGRAIVTEEAIVAYLYSNARDHDLYRSVDTIDYGVLKTIKGLTAGLEVSQRTARDWEVAILAGFRVWRNLIDGGGGAVVGQLDSGTLGYEPLDDSV